MKSSLTIPKYAVKNMRAFDLRRDLKPSANLIELCFADTLTDDGRRYLRNMRAAADVGSSAHWTALASIKGTFPLSGYVWEAAGEIVGNISMIPVIYRGHRLYLLANVVVHPDYRRQGIARKMTKTALEKLIRMRVQDVWLQARQDNPASIHLYSSMGFNIKATRTTWRSPADALSGSAHSDVQVTPRFGHQWGQQRQWLDDNYPRALRWHFNLKMTALKPGIIGWFYRFFLETKVRHWAAYQKNRLLGVLSWQAAHARVDHLWLAAPSDNEDAALLAILPVVAKEQRIHRPLNLDYPSGRAVDTLQNSGFTEQHTLLWMHKSL